MPIRFIAIAAILSLGAARWTEEKAKPADRIVVKHIEKVECREDGADLKVSVTGGAPQPGYEDVRLVRVVYDTPPEDGFQDFVLLATPPKLTPNVVSDVKGCASGRISERTRRGSRG